MRGNNSLVLISDDDEISREIVKKYLAEEGYSTAETLTGSDTLRFIEENLPDAVLLDVVMPEMSGIEVCRRIKANERTAHIPIIILTSLSGENYQLEGIKAGANDFLTKPIKRENLLFRVRNAVVLKSMYDKINSAYRELRDLEDLRDNLFHMIIHDLKQPITSISGFVQLLRMEGSIGKDSPARKYIEDINEQLRVLIEMIGSVMDVSRIESGKMPVDVGRSDVVEVARAVIDTFKRNVSSVKLELRNEAEKMYASFDRGLIYRVILNLLSNAIKWSPENGTVRVCVTREDRFVRVSIRDWGRGIPIRYQRRIFDKYWQVEGKKRGLYSSGLGLTFCRLAVEANGGEIGVKSREGEGSTFWFTLPAA